MGKIKIQGSDNGTATFSVVSPDNTSTDRVITLPDSTATLATTADVPSSITDNGDATAITIDSSENVQIGTTSGYGKVTIEHASGINNGLTLSSSSATANGNITGIQFSQGSNVTRPRAAIFAESVTSQSVAGHGADLCFATRGAPDGSTISTSDEKVRILSSGGITFNGDTSSANALDDYEEGTWTPTLGPGSGQSYASQVGTYTKVGNVVHCWVDLSLSAVGSITGSARILGLPFTPVSSPGIKPGSFICQNLNLPSGHKFTAGVYAANAFLYIWEEDVPPNGGVSQPGGESKFTNNSAMWGSFSYIAS